MTKKVISKDEFNKLCLKKTKASMIEVKLGDLELLIKAAKKSIKFAVMSDIYLGGELAVEDKQIAEAYKKTSKCLNKIKLKKQSEVVKKLKEKFEVKDV